MVSPIAWTSRCSVLSNQVQRWQKSLELTRRVHPEPPALFELLRTQSRSYVTMERRDAASAPRLHVDIP